jgi:DNA invertase Pin-like site-specific DNA recombinase
MARKSRKGVEAAVPLRENPITRVGAYVRLSAIDKKHKGDSLENQQSIISAYIAEQPGLELVETYIDNGLTGQTFERPAFQRMLADMESGKINCCVTKDLSRLGRNAIDMGYYIEKYFPSHHIRYVAVTDNYDSAAMKSAGNSCGGMMVSLKNMVNEAYALDIGRKIRATTQMHIRSGGFVGRLPPYGYLKSVEDCHKLVPDTYAAGIVRRIFDMAAGGQGVTAILDWLNGNGVLPPKRYFYSIGLASDKDASGHIHWNKGTVRKLLKNRVYTGDMVQGKTKIVNHIEVRLPQSEWVITENTHESIVSRALFAQVQERYATDEKPKARKQDNIFRRKVYCGHCGHAMCRIHNNRSYRFACTTRQDYAKDDCVLVSINENTVKEILLESLREQAAILDDTSSATAVKPVDDAALRSIQTETQRSERYLKGIYESLISGDLTDTEYREMKKSYEAKIAALTARERALRETARLAALESTSRRKAADSIGAVHCVDDLTAEVVDALVDKILVFEDKRIEISFKFRMEGFVHA